MANRLAQATSPYLLQHADNPVDWWEWEPDAFEEARRRDVPVLLSVGYAACHWCHVMAHESFEDPQVAAYLNEHFVAIKVDREERPDVDSVYMQVTTALSGAGGWPMTVAMDAAGKPFFAGTYFPDRPRHGQPSFSQLLQALVEAWRTKREQIEEMGSDIARRLGAMAPTDDRVDPDLLSQAVPTLRAEFDETRAGLGGAPKFPPWMVLGFLQRRDEPEAREVLDRTCTAMARGGIYDQVGGGFARYSVDAGWVVPHFEKMLYDNAQALGLYARWRDPMGERIARETTDFLLRELRTDDGAFASALDADSDGGEGKFYVWTPRELREVLGADDAEWATRLLRVTEDGTFEHGASTLQFPEGPEPAEAERWERVRGALRMARERRTRPARDHKVVAGWNGMAVSGLVAAGMRLGEADLVEAARTCTEHVWRTHWVDGRLRRVSREGRVGAPQAVLEDYGLLAQGLLDLAGATADPVWLRRAGELIEVAKDAFRGDSGWFDTAADAETLIARPSDPTDNASPSGTSAITQALLSWAALTGDSDARDLAAWSLRAGAALIRRAPRFAGFALSCLHDLHHPPPEVVLVGDHVRRSELAKVAVLAPSARVVTTVGPVEGFDLTLDRRVGAGEAAAYVCRHGVCAAPVGDPRALAEQLRTGPSHT